MRKQIAPLVALCDRARLLQVASKLVGNAIKFTGAEGRVTISAEERGENVRIAVTDNESAGVTTPKGEEISRSVSWRDYQL